MPKLTKDEKRLLILLVINQMVWLTATQMWKNNYKKLQKTTRTIDDFAALLIKKIEYTNPEILCDPEVVQFIYDYNFLEIAEQF